MQRPSDARIRTSRDPILHLPAEIQCKIFALLDFDSKVRCQEVCKSWNGLLQQPALPVWGSVVLDATALNDLQEKPTVQNGARCARLLGPITRHAIARQP